MLQREVQRRLSAGVEVQQEGGAHARVWAPACRTLEVILQRRTGDRATIPLAPDRDGYFEGFLEGATDGDTYWLQLDGQRTRPDPVSRFQPEGPHGPSMIVDPHAFRWTDAGWPGVDAAGQVIYEMHVGTFTPEGTWAAAARELDHLADLGVTVIELMPIADFAGRFGWGYDGVDLYAPTRLYGRPDDLRAFVDRAHALKLGVILDVVYNHLGPDGSFLAEFSPDYFTDRYKNDWGRALNFEGPPAARNFFVENAGYWIREFHFDGLRLDATQDIHDASSDHVLAEIVRSSREAGAPRTLYIVAENEPQDTKLVRAPEAGGFGADALWNDDYHHTAVVALTGRREAYYTDYRGTPQELISCARYGYLYQGQWYGWQKQRRGTPGLNLPPQAFVTYLENHDQVANSASGRRLHQIACPGRMRALTALTLLGPGTPMLFQGQEFAASSPFLYFADHATELRRAVTDGRREFLKQFPSLADPEVQAALAPVDESSFRRSKLDPSEREQNSEAIAMHKDLLRIRRDDPVLRRAACARPDGAVLGADAFVLRFYGAPEEGDRLLIVNLGADLAVRPIPEPLLAPPLDHRWRVAWSSEAPKYGGQGTPPLRVHADLYLPGQSALFLRSEAGEIDDRDDDDK